MTSNKKPGNSAPARNTTPNRSMPPSRRSARQERLASRQERRDLRTAGTYGKPGGVPPFLLWSGVAVVIAVVVIVAAFVVTQQPSTSSTSFNVPTVNTPSDIPANGVTLGKAEAPVTLDLYSDFRCSGCGQFVKNMEPRVVKDFVATGKVKLVYHDLLTIDADGSHASRDAANAALCAGDEGKFWPMHDWLFANQSPTESPTAFTTDRLIGIAKAAALDSPAFETCVKQGKHNDEIAAEQKSAPAGVNATPTLFVNGKVVNSSLGAQYQPTYDDIAKAIANATTGSSSSAPSGSAAPSAAASAS